MDIEWHPEARKEFLNLEQEVQAKVREYKNELKEKGTSWNKVELVIRKNIGLEAYRLKIMAENNEKFNHRMIFDIEESSYKIYKVGKRKGFYEKENLKEAERRI